MGLKGKIGLAAALALGLNTAAQSESRLEPADIRAMSEAQTENALALFRDFLSLPNDANKPDDILKLIEWMEPAFEARGFDMQRIDTEGSPLLLATRNVEGAEKTALIYLQSDGQPVDPAAWDQDDPFTPVLKKQTKDGWEEIPWGSLEKEIDPNWRIFARSASDSKGPMAQFLIAMDALNAAQIEPTFNLKVIIDTEEELGSPNLPQAVIDNRNLLAADMLLIFDGPPHASNAPTVKFGARGIVTIQLVAHGPHAPQHSGHYGNYVPNPALHLSRILAAMKSKDGRVTIPGFYDGVEVTDEVRAVLEAVPDDEKAIQKQLGIKTPDAVAGSLQESVQYPSLNIRGMEAGWVREESRTIIPATATAEIDIRLVKESDPDRLVGLVRDHIEGLGYHLLNAPPTDKEREKHDYMVEFRHDYSYAAYRSDFDAPPGRLARSGLRNLYGEEPILIRTSGGSVPISPFVETLSVPAASVPTVNIDNNQHSPNENIRVGNFLEGIAMLTAVLSEGVEE